MKKKITLLCLMVLGILLLPKLVLADEIPRTGVHYFLTYPNGEEVVTKSYDEATNAEEKLIYSGLTSSEGQVVLEGLLDKGTLRIVQKVPNGYTTDTTEVTLDLAQGKSNVEFIDYKGSNPNTGQSLFFIILVVAALLIAAKAIKLDTKKTMMFLLPIVIIGTVILQVKAAEDNLVITIKDKSGNKLAGVEIEVYAKPILDYGPAVTVSANGGHFFDGKTEMIYRLPSAPCTWDDFADTLESNEYNYLVNNMWGSYREGYYIDTIEDPDTLTDDTVIKVLWEADESIKYIKVHGNGGTYDFYGHPLETVVFSNGVHIPIDMTKFTKKDKIMSGIGDSTTCDNMITDYSDDMPEDLYVCWGDVEDGIYINDEFIKGNPSSCFTPNGIGKYDNYYVIGNGSSRDLYVYIDNSAVRISFGPAKKSEAYVEINNVKIVFNGKEIVSLISTDLNLTEGEYVVTDQTKADAIRNYFSKVKSSCLN